MNTTPTEPIEDDRERYLVISIGDHYAIVVQEEE